MSIIEMKNLEKAFGKKILFDHLSLTIEENELVAITGPSGSGKSTLLNMIGLIEPCENGSYMLFGNKAPKPDSSEASRMIRRHISYLFQNYALIDQLTVEENLMLALRYRRKTKEEKKQLIKKALHRVGMDDSEEQKVYTLSGGEAQRIALARVMLKPGELVLADEPTGSLDEENKNMVFNHLQKLKNAGKTIIVVTHDNELANRCDRVIHLAQ